ncbi:MAG: hypothetical protein ACKO25_10285 [Cyanobium sp.]
MPLPARVLRSLFCAAPLAAGLAAPLLAAPLLAAAPAPAAPIPDPGCRAPAAGRYVVMQQGSAGTTPMARLLQEQWHADGRIEGVLMERRGRAYRERAYVGRARAEGACRVTIERLLAMDPPGERPLEVLRSGAVLDASGRPAYSLDLAEGTVLTGRWWNQGTQACTPATLGGVVLSQQQGLSWQDGRWRPNAVVQRELWRDGRVEGLALMSVAGKQVVAPYDGSLAVRPRCLGTIREKDANGVLYNYAAVVLADGGGYLYL